MSTQRTVTGPAVIKLGISNLVWPRPWRPKLCLLERQRAGREGGGRSGAAPAPPRRLPSSRCNKAALSGPPSVCRRVRDSCVLRFSAPGGPALQGRAPPRPAAGLHCCWSVPGSRQGQLANSCTTSLSARILVTCAHSRTPSWLALSECLPVRSNPGPGAPNWIARLVSPASPRLVPVDVVAFRASGYRDSRVPTLLSPKSVAHQGTYKTDR